MHKSFHFLHVCFCFCTFTVDTFHNFDRCTFSFSSCSIVHTFTFFNTNAWHKQLRLRCHHFGFSASGEESPRREKIKRVNFKLRAFILSAGVFFSVFSVHALWLVSGQAAHQPIASLRRSRGLFPWLSGHRLKPGTRQISRCLPWWRAQISADTS